MNSISFVTTLVHLHVIEQDIARFENVSKEQVFQQAASTCDEELDSATDWDLLYLMSIPLPFENLYQILDSMYRDDLLFRPKLHVIEEADEDNFPVIKEDWRG